MAGQAVRPGFCVAFLALVEAPGLRRGAAAFGGRGAAPGPPLGLPNKRANPGPKAPGSLFQGASRPAAAPPERWDFPPPKRSIHHPFPPRLPIKKPSPPLPMSGGPAHSAGTPEKFSSQFSPAFFKSGPGVWGRSPQRGPGAEHLAGSGAEPRQPCPVTPPGTGGRRFGRWRPAAPPGSTGGAPPASGR